MKHASLVLRLRSAVQRRARGASCTLIAGLLPLTLLAVPSAAQGADTAQFVVKKYDIKVQLFPTTHILEATTRIDFVPQTSTSQLGFELDSALRVQKIADATGTDVQFQQEGLSLKVILPSPVTTGQASSITVSYKGGLGTAEGSPVEGLKLSYVGPEGSYLLYPGRWFPVVRPGLNRFTAALHVTVPTGETVIASGTPSPPVNEAGNTTYSFEFGQSSFPGTFYAGDYSVQQENASGANVYLFLKRGHERFAADYGAAAAKIMSFFSGQFGSLPNGNLAVVEIADDTAGGYSSPGIVALASRGFSSPVNEQLLAHEISRQWWNCYVSPAAPDDSFLDDGLALYSSALYIEQSQGETAFESLMHATAIGALTHEESAPISQAGSLQPFTPQYQSIVAQKGAMVFHMLRWVIGDDAFTKALHEVVRQYAWKSISTQDFEKVVEQASNEKLTYFFAQWVSSTGVPQFKDSWAIYRAGDHYQVVGKIQQDLDIFRMPVEVRVNSEGRRPVNDRVQMVGTTADFTVNTVTRPTRVEIDPGSHILKMTDTIRTDVEIARGDQLVAEQAYLEAVKQYQQVVEQNKNNSLAHFRLGQIYFRLHNYNAAAEEMRAALDGNLQPKWVEVWAHLTLGKIFDATGQRDRALNEYQRALQTKDDTQGAIEQAKEYIQKPYSDENRATG
ncbi:MAG: tetratricopeptide repeat protein [Acidobacteria bacterium]|nr:MAG: tetratricopeptide repeat protein [Acidobacteriota bacterium]